jgi:hypothetical protein
MSCSPVWISEPVRGLAIQKRGENGSSPLNTGAGSYQNNSIFPGLAFKV